ncbi:F-box domain-containing [Fusarium albosuccineum]|uniref:F-box domain-containing n=1 Tax=Fusarium albosuccineum TaxID=1237068 RepID=A0A8H4LC77_9HYPO|nr:F-box domain-containing [Fusarium albosuccineum]
MAIAVRGASRRQKLRAAWQRHERRLPAMTFGFKDGGSLYRLYDEPVWLTAETSALETLGSEAIISRLSDANPVVQPFFDPTKMPALFKLPPYRSSSIGPFEKLPIELSQEILNDLDLQSLSRLSCASFGFKKLVECLPAYRDLLTIASIAVIELSEARLLGVHSAELLWHALRTDRCDFCPRFGAYLFMLTCRRCCLDCLDLNPTLRVIPLDEAKGYFGLMTEHLEHLQTMIYWKENASLPYHRVPEIMVSESSARELWMSLAGKPEYTLSNTMKAARRRVLNEMEHRVNFQLFIKYWDSHPDSVASSGSDFEENSVSDPRHCVFWDPLALPFQPLFMPDDPRPVHREVAAFPWLHSGQIVENGLWCKGCRHTFERYSSGQLDFQELCRHPPPGRARLSVLRSRARRAMTRAEFLDHIKSCFGARQILRY